MRILFVGNNQTERCGVAEWGRHCVAALRKIGHAVFDWHQREEPENPPIPDADVVFANWHAGTLGWEPRWRTLGKLTSAYLHESSPAWNQPEHRPPLLDQVDMAFVDHPAVQGWKDFPTEVRVSNVIYFRTPVWDVVPKLRDSFAPASVRRITIGCTGIRKEGLDAMLAFAQRQADQGRLYVDVWPSSDTDWRTPEEEVSRLSACWINVAHYGAGFGGQASAMGALIAAGQPILINSNRMLETWREYAEEGRWEVLQGSSGVAGKIPILPQLYLDDDLERGLLTILADIRDGKARRPTWLRQQYSWPRQAERMVREWERKL